MEMPRFTTGFSRTGKFGWESIWSRWSADIRSIAFGLGRKIVKFLKERWPVAGAGFAVGKARADLCPPERWTYCEFPAALPPVLMMFGCRSAAYYAEPLIASSPDSSFVFTNDLWAPDHAMQEVMESLLLALQQRADVQGLLPYWEDLCVYDQLTGRQSELQKFGATNDTLPDSLLLWHPLADK